MEKKGEKKWRKRKGGEKKGEKKERRREKGREKRKGCTSLSLSRAYSEKAHATPTVLTMQESKYSLPKKVSFIVFFLSLHRVYHREATL